MMTNDTGRAAARTRAQRRLQRMTIGTAIAAVVATGGLGWVAALTHDGSQARAAATIVSSELSTDTGLPSTAAAADAGAPTVTAVSGGAIATTGGS